MGNNRTLEDPRSYVHFISWEDLASTNAEDLRRSGLNPDIPFLESDITIEWVLWTPPYPGFAWNHHLHTEDEVYEYSVVNHWALPDHYLSDQVVFSVTEIDKTDFISQLRDYWETWVSLDAASSKVL